jgi:hypothetical protein
MILGRCIEKNRALGIGEWGIWEETGFLSTKEEARKIKEP